MIHRHEGPPDPASLQELADLQARAYGSTGMRPWTADEIASLLSNEFNRLYTIHEDATNKLSISAFLIAAFVAGEAEILSLAVDPRRRRARLASSLVERLVKDCRHAGMNSIILEVAEINAPALSLYRSLTFDRVGQRAGYYMLNGSRVDAYVLRRRIAGVV